MRKILLILLMWGITMVEAAKPHEAIFAGGCFWCIEEALHNMHGVINTEVGFTGGTTANPTYDQVTHGVTGHRESLRVVYDPSKITYEQLLIRFWQNVDATDGGGQFCDRGESYKSAVYYTDSQQKQLATTSKTKIAKQLGQKVATDIIKAGQFYKAEDYHQGYHLKNPIRYKFYKYRCGRAARLQQLWSKTAASFWAQLF